MSVSREKKFSLPPSLSDDGTALVYVTPSAQRDRHTLFVSTAASPFLPVIKAC